MKKKTRKKTKELKQKTKLEKKSEKASSNMRIWFKKTAFAESFTKINHTLIYAVLLDMLCIFSLFLVSVFMMSIVRFQSYVMSARLPFLAAVATGVGSSQDEVMEQLYASAPFIKTMIIKFLLVLALAFFLIILVLALFRSLIWKMIIKEKYDLRYFLKFIGLYFLWWIIFIVIVLFTVIAFRSVVAGLLMFVEILLFLYLVLISHTIFSKNSSIKNILGQSIKIGILRIWKFIPVFLVSGLLIYISFGLIASVAMKLGNSFVIIAVIWLLLAVAWARNYVYIAVQRNIT
ncbi:hypothetical protein ACFL0W_04805 [Nanoarchaeota archaeon]